MAKIDRILELLETRIARGDYAMTLFPTEHGLAEEMDIGRMTARRAILRLAEKGLLYRDASGRMAVTTEHLAKRPIHVGFVTAILSPSVLRWLRAAEQSVQEVGGHLRVVTYFHWDDPTLLEVMDSFDGVFLFPPAEPLSSQLAARILSSRARVVVLEADYSPLGLPSVNLIPEDAVDVLLDHLVSLGHHQIALLNTQPLVPSIEERIGQWQNGLFAHECEGELINEPELSYGDPMQRAYEVAKERFENGEGMSDSAVLCATLPAALGFMRAASECDLVIGRDYSICTVDNEGMGLFLSPTLTSPLLTDPNVPLHDCVNWMAGEAWEGPLLKRAPHSDLFVGQSTGPRFYSLID